MSKAIVVVDFGGSRTDVYTGHRIETFPRTFRSSSREELLAFLRSVVPADTSLVVLVFPARLVRQNGGWLLSPMSTKFDYLTGPISAIEADLGRVLGCRNLFMQDGHVASWGAIAVGDVKPGETAFVTMVGSSPSGGLVYRGQPVEGPFTSQFSHLTLDPNGPPCPGKQHRGCVKMFLGANVLSDRAVELGLPKDLQEVTRPGKRGATGALACYASAGERLAHALSQVANPIPLDTIVLGGGIACGGGGLLLRPLRGAFTPGPYIGSNLAATIDLTLPKSANLAIEGARYLAE